MAELVACEVIGPLPIVDASGAGDIVKPNVVLLDPDQTNIPALIAAGHVKYAEPEDTEQ